MLKKIFQRNIYIIICILLTFFAIRALFVPGFFPIHDDEQVSRLYELEHAVYAGNLPPRLSQNLGFGYDYPLFNFYPSFIYYIAEVYRLLGFGYIFSIKLMIITGFVLTALFMYFFSRKYVGELGGIVSSVAYTYASYHAIDVYIRGALPEFWSFVWLPAIFWIYTKLQHKQSFLHILLSGMFLALFVLTHNLIAMMSSIFIFCFLIYLFVTTKEKRSFFLAVMATGIIGLSLSAYFWLPAIAEKQYTLVNLLTTELANYKQHFVYPIQFWYSPWGYGGSTAGLADGLSFQISKRYLFLLLLTIPLIVVYIKKKQKVGYLLALFMLLFFFSLYMQTAYSKIIWDYIPSLWYVQFPWRFLILSSFTMSFLIGSLFLMHIHEYAKKIIAVLIIITIIWGNKNYFQPQKFLTHVTDNNYINEQIIRWDISNKAFEYVPKGIATKKSSRGVTVVDIKKNEIARGSYSILSGNMQIKVIKDIPQEKILYVSTKHGGELRFNAFSFPGWKTVIDNKEIQYSDNNKLKLITVKLPAGNHEIKAIFTNTIIRTFGNVITLCGVIVLLILFLIKWSYKNMFVNKATT